MSMSDDWMSVLLTDKMFKQNDKHEKTAYELLIAVNCAKLCVNHHCDLLLKL